MKTVRLNKEQLRNIVKESVRRLISEYDEQAWANYIDDMNNNHDICEDFDDRWFLGELAKVFPGVDFDCECDASGRVTVVRIEDGAVFNGKGDEMTYYAGTGMPSPVDRDVEMEQEYTKMDFTNALKEIIAKIKANRPDSVDEA